MIITPQFNRNLICADVQYFENAAFKQQTCASVVIDFILSKDMHLSKPELTDLRPFFS